MKISRPNNPARQTRPKPSKFESDGLEATRKQEAREERIQDYVRRNSGELSNDGSGDYKIGVFHYRTYPWREGYDENFLGTKIGLPKLDESVADQAATRIDDPNEIELEYTHFSIVQNKMRRMPFFTAVNVDGASSEIIRGKNKWAYEGRLRHKHQLGNIAYKNNDLDRGHMVHGQSPAWGPQGEMARADTYNYANVALQHKKLNQEEWLDLENQVLDHAGETDTKVSVFAGPVFAKDDRTCLA